MVLDAVRLQESFREIAPQGEEFVSAFYDRLFEKHPELRALFARTDMEAQRKKLLGALVLVVEHLRSPEVLAPTLAALGRRHQEVGVLPEHYPLVGEVLLETLAAFLQDRWTPELAAAWQGAYEFLARQLLQSYASAA